MATITIYRDSSRLPFITKSDRGFVYVVSKTADQGPCKVGIASNPRKRVFELENMNGHRFPRIWISAQCSNFAAIEQALHEQLKSSRMIGEWFNMSFYYVAHTAAVMKYRTTTAMDFEILRKAADSFKIPTQEMCDAALAIEARMWGPRETA